MVDTNIVLVSTIVPTVTVVLTIGGTIWSKYMDKWNQKDQREHQINSEDRRRAFDFHSQNLNFVRSEIAAVGKLAINAFDKFLVYEEHREISDEMGFRNALRESTNETWSGRLPYAMLTLSDSPMLSTLGAVYTAISSAVLIIKSLLDDLPPKEGFTEEQLEIHIAPARTALNTIYQTSIAMNVEINRAIGLNKSIATSP